MPRILPRLLEKLANSKSQPHTWEPFHLPRQRPKSLYKPVPPRPSFNPADHPKSLLLASPETNPITSSRVYVHHKTFPPRIRLPRRAKSRPAQPDRPRAMTSDEQRWWSNPYLRMLASPIRKCIATERYLPTDFLIRLARMRLPPDLVNQKQKRHSDSTVLIPDGLQHSKFTARNSGTAMYVLCSKEAISDMAERTAKHLAARKISVHALLAEQIAHLLRVRVLQELELLGDHMQHYISKTKPGPRILRRLTRDEWNAIRETGLIPYPGALAVLVVPPLQRDPVTKRRPLPSMTTAPIIEENPAIPTKPLRYISTLHPQTADHPDIPLHRDVLPQAQIPLYNCVPLYPLRPQRAALYNLLTRLLDIERKSNHLTCLGTKIEPVVNKSPQGKRASHAFLLSSDAETIARGDAAAVAIALWRLRMFEHGIEASG